MPTFHNCPYNCAVGRASQRMLQGQCASLSEAH
jgi:hypothetical protein